MVGWQPFSLSRSSISDWEINYEISIKVKINTDNFYVVGCGLSIHMNSCLLKKYNSYSVWILYQIRVAVALYFRICRDSNCNTISITYALMHTVYPFEKRSYVLMIWWEISDFESLNQILLFQKMNISVSLDSDSKCY